MKLTEIDMTVLRAVASYYVLSASQIHRICFPQNRDRRTTRRRLARLVDNKFLARSGVNVAFSTGNAGPAYYPTAKSCEYLATYFGDDAWLSTNTRPPRLDRLYHWLDISETHFILEQAVARSDGVTLCGWINEWEAVNKDDARRDQFVLHTQLREQPALSCSPDAAFMIEADGYRCVHYVEVDRGTSGARRVAASKTPGYAELARIQGHRRHFPETTFADFAVLIITVSANQRDQLAKEVSKKSDNRPDLWLFADGTDFTPEKALYESIFHDHQGIAGPLLQARANDAAQRNQTSDPADSSLALESAS